MWNRGTNLLDWSHWAVKVLNRERLVWYSGWISVCIRPLLRVFVTGVNCLPGGFILLKKKLSKLFSENNYWENGLTVRKGHVLMKSFLKECNLTRIANCRMITVQCARGVFTHHCWTACCQFAQQGWIKLIETDSEGFYNVTKDFYRFLKLSTL